VVAVEVAQQPESRVHPVVVVVAVTALTLQEERQLLELKETLVVMPELTGAKAAVAVRAQQGPTRLAAILVEMVEPALALIRLT
jgi:hypothetical protein